MGNESPAFCSVCGEPVNGFEGDHCAALVSLLEAAKAYVSESPHPANHDWWQKREELRAAIDYVEAKQE